ncbi:MAG: nucleoside diphosphate kinase regulator [Candidatus Binatia bacterium]
MSRENSIQSTVAEDTILVCADDFERLESLIAASGKRRDAAAMVALQGELDRARVVEAEAIPHDVVKMRSRVRFVDESTGAAETVTLVYPFEADATRGYVSVLAPLGSALIGLRIGQAVAWPMPNGSVRQLRVLAVEDGDSPA